MMAEADLNVIADMGSLSMTTFPVRYSSLITGFLRFEQKTLSDYIAITLPSLPRISVGNARWARFPQDQNPEVVSDLFFP